MADKDTRAFARVLKCFRVILERFCKGDGGRRRRVGWWVFALGLKYFIYIYIYIYIYIEGVLQGRAVEECRRAFAGVLRYFRHAQEGFCKGERRRAGGLLQEDGRRTFAGVIK